MRVREYRGRVCLVGASMCSGRGEEEERRVDDACARRAVESGAHARVGVGWREGGAGMGLEADTRGERGFRARGAGRCAITSSTVHVTSGHHMIRSTSIFCDSWTSSMRMSGTPSPVIAEVGIRDMYSRKSLFL